MRCVLPMALAVLLLSGCDHGPFDDPAAQALLESGTLQLEGEQALVTPDQILCGEKKRLWTIDQQEGGGAIARLDAPARALRFTDDIRMGEHRFSNPAAQISGTFKVRVLKFGVMTDEGPASKLVEAKLGVVMDHECFKQPLPLLGIDRGDFSEETPPRVRLQLAGDWRVDRLIH